MPCAVSRHPAHSRETTVPKTDTNKPAEISLATDATSLACAAIAVPYEILVALGPGIVCTILAIRCGLPWGRWRDVLIVNPPLLAFFQELFTFASFTASTAYVWFEPCIGHAGAVEVYVAWVLVTLSVALACAMLRQKHALVLEGKVIPRHPSLRSRLLYRNQPVLEVLQAVCIHLAFIAPALYVSLDHSSPLWLRIPVAALVSASSLYTGFRCAVQLHMVERSKVAPAVRSGVS